MENASRIRYALLFVALFAIGFFAVKSYQEGHTETPEPAMPVERSGITVDQFEEDTHRLGPKEAPYTLIYYIDYDCPYCKASMGSLSGEVAKYGGDLRIIVRQLPLSDIHPTAYKKSVLAECLTAKGADFFKLSEYLFEKQNIPASELTATDLGVSSDEDVRACMDDATGALRVRTAGTDAALHGLYTTPSMTLSKGETLLVKANLVAGGRLENILAALMPKR